MPLIDRFIERAKEKPRRIVLPEGDDQQMVRAACRLAAERIAIPIILGRREQVAALAEGESIDGFEIVDPSSPDKLEKYGAAYAAHREGVTEKMALRLVKRLHDKTDFGRWHQWVLENQPAEVSVDSWRCACAVAALADAVAPPLANRLLDELARRQLLAPDDLYSKLRLLEDVAVLYDSRLPADANRLATQRTKSTTVESSSAGASAGVPGVSVMGGDHT